MIEVFAMKRLLTLFITICVVLSACSVVASAEGEAVVTAIEVATAEEVVIPEGAIAAGYVGNSDALIDVKNPEGPSYTTSAKTFVISAIAVEGATVSVFSFNPETGYYEKLYTEVTEIVDETPVVKTVPVESVVGASGLYAQQITLKDGLNNILVYATKDGMDETVRFDINFLGESFLDKIKAFTVEIATEIGSIF